MTILKKLDLNDLRLVEQNATIKNDPIYKN